MKPQRAMLVSVVLAGVATLLLAHEAKDPVCGMIVDTDKTPADQAVEYAGQKYYFCLKSEADQFRADPEKYVTLAKMEVVVDGYRYALSVEPRQLREGDLATLTLMVPPGIERKLARWGEGAGERVPLGRYFYFSAAREEYDRGWVAFHPGGQPGQYAIHRLFLRPGECRVVAEVKLPGGARHRPVFRLIVSARPPGESPAPPPELDPKTGELSMENQHKTMQYMGEHWLALEGELRRETPDWGQVLDHAKKVRAVGPNLPKFKLHKFEEDMAEFGKLARELDSALAGLERILDGQDREASIRAVQEVDAMNCTKCHFKFRWGAVDDLSGFPDLKVR